jgi:GNAT superfamily N-acetyltransferase
MIEYRIAIKSDLKILAQMRYDYWLEDGNHKAEVDKETFTHECETFLLEGLTTKQWTYWLAVLNEEIISHLFIQRVNKIPKPSKVHDAFGYVSNVYTKPLYRGKGIGKNLIKHAQDWALKQDLEFLILWPSEESNRFYERAGFSCTEAVTFTVREYFN